MPIFTSKLSGGLVTNQASDSIADNQCQAISNFDVFPSFISRRKGTTLFGAGAGAGTISLHFHNTFGLIKSQKNLFFMRSFQELSRS